MAWEKVKLGDVASVTSSKRIFAHQYVDDGVPFYRQKEIIERNNKQDVSEPLFISQDLYDEIEKKYGVPSEGDLLITGVGVTLGIPYVVGKEIFYFKDGNLIWLKNFKPTVSSKFIYYFISSEKGQKAIWSRVIGAAQPALTIDIVKQYELEMPDFKTQKRIADILSAYDNLIENNQKQIKLLEEAAQRLYKEWFIDLRFPGHETTKIQNDLPAGWSRNRADSFFAITIGKTPPRAESQWFTDGTAGYPWLSIADMGSGCAFILETSEGLTAEAIKRHNVKVVPENTVLLSFKLTVGRVGISATEICTNEAIAHFVTKNEILREYTYCYLKNFHYDELGSTSSISKAINSKIVKGMPFVMPEDNLLEQFHKELKPYFDEMLIKQKQIRNLKEARDRLLPKLMSGEIEV